MGDLAALEHWSNVLSAMSGEVAFVTADYLCALRALLIASGSGNAHILLLGFGSHAYLSTPGEAVHQSLVALFWAIWSSVSEPSCPKSVGATP